MRLEFLRDLEGDCRAERVARQRVWPGWLRALDVLVVGGCHFGDGGEEAVFLWAAAHGECVEGAVGHGAGEREKREHVSGGWVEEP